VETRSTIDRITNWASEFPDRIAMKDERSEIMFGDLMVRLRHVADAVAQARSQAPPVRFLPVVVDRSVDAAVVVLACLVHRIPFFPIDSRAHPDFARTLLARVGDPTLALVATREHPLPGDVLQVDLSGGPPQEKLTSGDATALPRDEDEALVIFTSGSTGEPKGVVFDWLALDRRWRFRDSIAPADRTGFSQPLIAPLDALWGVMLLSDVTAGCSVMLIDPARLRPSVFLQRLADFGPSHVPMPSQLGRILSQLPDALCVRLPTVAYLSVGSEGFRYEHVAGLMRIFPADAILAHNLATTEGGRMMHHEVRLGDAPTSGIVHVGRPVFPDDIRLRPVPHLDAEASEVLVAGAIATRYLGEPERTTARFDVDGDGRRWWASGDLVTVSPNGLYRHHGRVDDIVKVRGRLASPSDVTAVLLQIPGVKGAITIPVTHDHNVRLVAHVELETETVPSLGEIRSVLTRRLPAHLQPSAVMRHARLPVNVRGKIDRQTLMNGPFEPWPEA
jgi:acyl-CoA synthetase (AMP-forming)/AMP-acid ligase II